MINIKDKIIIETCNKSNSMSDAANELNVSIMWLKRNALRLDCWQPNKGGSNTIKFPNGRANWNKFDLDKWDEGENIECSRPVIRRAIKKYNLLEPKCEKCNLDTWMGQELLLELDHINGNANEHNKNNLRYLCPNCHSQTNTFRNKSRK
jgi:Zn finger protein HypA/HybF involved in hydrogenase expression